MGQDRYAERPVALASTPSEEPDVVRDRRSESKRQAGVTLTGDPAALDAIFKSVDGRRSAPPKRIETYFDTADGRLHKRGYVLKMRRNGAGHEMTLRHRAVAAGWSAQHNRVRGAETGLRRPSA